MTRVLKPEDSFTNHQKFPGFLLTKSHVIKCFKIQIRGENVGKYMSLLPSSPPLGNKHISTPMNSLQRDPKLFIASPDLKDGNVISNSVLLF